MVEHAYNELKPKEPVRPHKKVGQAEKKKGQKQIHMECIYI